MAMTEGVKPAAEVSAAQTSDGEWPRPGDEGYVTPDGTEQSRRQLAANRQAAADRAAAGSTIHGAPMATPGPQMHEQMAAAAKRAEDYSGRTEKDRREGVTEFIREKTAEAAEQVAASEQPVAGNAPEVDARSKQRTADTSKDSAQR